jgi:hypothetical protein
VGGPPLGTARRGAPIAGVGAAPSVSGALLRYLKSHQGSAKYIVAARGSGTAGAIALQSGREAIDMGGFMGSDPAPSLTKLRSLIDSRHLHYVLVGGAGSGPGSAGAVGGPAGSGFAPRVAAQASGAEAAILTRETWVREHGTLVHVPGFSSGSTLYYFR